MDSGRQVGQSRASRSNVVIQKLIDQGIVGVCSTSKCLSFVCSEEDSWHGVIDSHLGLKSEHLNAVDVLIVSQGESLVSGSDGICW